MTPQAWRIMTLPVRNGIKPTHSDIFVRMCPNKEYKWWHHPSFMLRRYCIENAQRWREHQLSLTWYLYFSSSVYPAEFEKGIVRTITLHFCRAFTDVLTIVTLKSSTARTFMTDEVTPRIKNKFKKCHLINYITPYLWRAYAISERKFTKLGKNIIYI